MITPILLLCLSLVGLVAAILVPGMSDLLLLAVPSTVASLILLLTGWRKRGGREVPNWVVLDGSNVMHWKDGTAQIETVRDVINALTRAGFTPGVVFDANAGHKLQGSYLNDRTLSRQLGLPRDRVMVVPRGEPADPRILEAARDYGARIVTNDRFRDWAAIHPEVHTAGHLITGGYHNGKLWLSLDGAAAPQPLAHS